jgi:hypothetical protein
MNGGATFACYYTVIMHDDFYFCWISPMTLAKFQRRYFCVTGQIKNMKLTLLNTTQKTRCRHNVQNWF